MFQIITVPKTVLRQKAKKVENIDENILKIIKGMEETLENDPRKGIGLAAPQVGISLRIILAKDGRGQNSSTHVLINPEVFKMSPENIVDYEGCLSIPDTYVQVERSSKVMVKARNRAGEKITLKASDLFARVLQHEIDHTNGILITDKAVGETLTEEKYNQLMGI